MKICTITCHDVYNHGASLQAYALMTYLSDCGHEVEIIDYKPEYLSRHYRLFSIDHPKWRRNVLMKAAYLAAKLPGRILERRRKRAFDAFTAAYLQRTPNRYASNEELKASPPEADVYLCGSDQIWNALHPNGKDPAFYLDFVPEGKIKASYAASFATESIPEGHQTFVKEMVSKLDGISVRESSGLRILQQLGIHRACQVVDPVFLLERSAWDRMARQDVGSGYVLVYDFDNSPLVKEIAQDLASKKGLQIYTVNKTKLKYADKSFIYSGPDVFVSLVKHADYVVSNSFHAAVLSIIYEKDFAIVNRTEAINTRMRDLLKDLHLSHRLIGESYHLFQIIEPVDYSRAKSILAQNIHASKQYLDSVLTMTKTGAERHEKIVVRD